MKTITKKLTVADLVCYPITNGLFIALVLFAGHLLGYVSDWAYEKNWWLLGAPIRFIEFTIQVVSVCVAIGVFLQWIKLLKIYLTNREATIQHKVMVGRDHAQSSHDTSIRASEIFAEIVTVFYDRIKLAILKNEGNYSSDSYLSVNEKYIMDEVLYLQCLRSVYSGNARKQKCLTLFLEP